MKHYWAFETGGDEVATTLHFITVTPLLCEERTTWYVNVVVVLSLSFLISMTRRPSIYVNVPTLSQSMLFSSSSSLITLDDDSHSKPTLSPFYKYLPPTQNSNNIVSLISFILKRKSSDISLLHSTNNGIKVILPHLGPHEISRVM